MKSLSSKQESQSSRDTVFSYSKGSNVVIKIRNLPIKENNPYDFKYFVKTLISIKRDNFPQVVHFLLEPRTQVFKAVKLYFTAQHTW